MNKLGRSDERKYPIDIYGKAHRTDEKWVQALEFTLFGITDDLYTNETRYDDSAIAFSIGKVEPRTEPLMIDKWEAQEGSRIIPGLTLIVRGQGEIQDRVRRLLSDLGLTKPTSRLDNGAELYVIAVDPVIVTEVTYDPQTISQESNGEWQH